MLFRIARLALLACLLHIFTSCNVFANAEEQKVENALKLIKHLSETRKGLTALKQIVKDIDDDLQSTQKRTCAVGGGMGGHCAASFVSNGLSMQDWLRGGMSPGKKRALQTLTPEKRREMQSTLEDLSRKRKGLEILSKFIDEMEADLINEQKRTCNFNLGGHCATESAAYVADHWHYLNSALSPGRKRRDTGLYRKLVSGKLLE